ncbi:MAG: CDP-glucose 4,6-dehydratase [Lachnospiraceae bacterium]
MNKDLSFYKGKRILVTGNTGFKGSWMCRMLLKLGAQVTGYALEPPTTPSLFALCGLPNEMHTVIGDIRDLSLLQKTFEEVQPQIVIHMAAQPIVRESYKDPVYTYDVNVMGTVNVLECIRKTESVKSFVNVTTDKVYLNREWEWGYRENEELKGYDPYSNSKSCSELVTYSYVNSFFNNRDIAVSTARAGNVIGGGDFATDRIIPDCIRAASEGKDIIVRNPYSTRPYQHVLEPVYAYLMIAMAQYENPELAGNYNVGPDDVDCYATGELVTLFCKKWKEQTGKEIQWLNQYDGGPHEANFLKLDCSKLKQVFAWQPCFHVEECMEQIAEWYWCYLQGGDVTACMDKQIDKMIKAVSVL